MKKKSGLAVTGLVLGIVGISLSFIPIINNASFVLGALAFIFGIIPLIKKESKGKAIAAVVLGILTIIIVLSLQASWAKSLNDIGKELEDASGENTKDILEKNVEVTFDEFQFIPGEYGLNETKLVVTVKNKEKETKSFSIQIEAVDKDGNRINTDYIYADNLTKEQSQDFEAFTYVSDDDLELMKTATFKVVDVSMY